MKAEYAHDVELICRLDRRWKPSTIRVKRLGGQTNRNFLVKYQKEKSFVRLPWERADMIDRMVEGKNVMALARNKKLASIIPKYYIYILKKRNILAPKSNDVFDVPDGTTVTEFIEGKEFTFRMFQQKKYQEVLAKALHAFHASGVRFVNPYDVFRDEIEKYRLEATKHQSQKLLDENAVQKLLKIEKEAKQKLLVSKRGISTHNDFIFQNILVAKSNRLYLLDFEYAGLSMRGGAYYDLGYLFAGNLFRISPITKKSFENFLAVADRVYGYHLDREQIYAASLATVLVQFWWGLLRYFSVDTKKEKGYFAKYVQDRVRGVEFVYSLVRK